MITLVAKWQSARFFPCGAGDLTWGLVHGRQVLCHRGLTVIWDRRSSLEPKEESLKETLSSKSGFLKRSLEDQEASAVHSFALQSSSCRSDNLLVSQTPVNPTSKLVELPTTKAKS